ncbi:MAG: formyltransferase family protein [Planctomycetota bacterium]|jgi:phosphoribosylglycinamide formyltransferase-1|nr:formyltransferase family protein [Planctomycetota bacterium]
MRIGILLSGGGTTYANLAAEMAAGRLPGEICGVISSRAGVAGLDKAAANGHRHTVAKQPEAVSAALAEFDADLVVMCGWMVFWDPPARWQGRTLNIHPSLLPSFGGTGMYGRRVHDAVVAAGCKVSGCTAHLVAGAYDTGPILAQRVVPVLGTDQPADLEARVQAAERQLYPLVVAALVEARVVEQDGRLHIPNLPVWEQ